MLPRVFSSQAAAEVTNNAAAPATPRSEPDGLGRVVVISSGKGGVGKTTCAASFSYGLAKRGLKTPRAAYRDSSCSGGGPNLRAASVPQGYACLLWYRNPQIPTARHFVRLSLQARLAVMHRLPAIERQNQFAEVA